jgi:hypothetical protein
MVLGFGIGQQGSFDALCDPLQFNMITGRATRLALTLTKTGVFRASCAEYSGISALLVSWPDELLRSDRKKAAFERCCRINKRRR